MAKCRPNTPRRGGRLHRADAHPASHRMLQSIPVGCDGCDGFGAATVRDQQGVLHTVTCAECGDRTEFLVVEL
ncbi:MULTISPECIES: hypothetical protein [Kitasatospora]|uniref:hypothetical protein n=1 Tax=Kitasatospora TaxID=2063 RepID=UPI000C27943B|nr:hypothetical protein [Kitasatospora sp. CB02891]PJN21135.1 hypothetical protein CG736_34910 [Kitasatospora sp. CB02891]